MELLFNKTYNCFSMIANMYEVLNVCVSHSLCSYLEYLAYIKFFSYHSLTLLLPSLHLKSWGEILLFRQMYLRKST